MFSGARTATALKGSLEFDVIRTADNQIMGQIHAKAFAALPASPPSTPTPASVLPSYTSSLPDSPS